MNGPVVRLKRSDWYLAQALDPNLSPIQRAASFDCHQLERWFEAVTYRGFPVLSVPAEYAKRVMSLLQERNKEPLSGFQVRP